MPEPVAPTTSTRPRLVMTTSFRISGRPSFSKFGISAAIVRITMPTCCCCTNTLTRKRETPGTDDREVALEVLRELLALALVHHRVGELARHLAGELLARSAASCCPCGLHARREVVRDEQVGAAGLASWRRAACACRRGPGLRMIGCIATPGVATGGGMLADGEQGADHRGGARGETCAGPRCPIAADILSEPFTVAEFGTRPLSVTFASALSI